MSTSDETSDQNTPLDDSAITQDHDSGTGRSRDDGELTVDDPNRRDKSGTTVAGKYRLLECVGEGGMGSVWRAEQREPVKRMVAVKLIKAGMDSKAVLTRFEAERQALAVMDHPNIARIYDGGVTETGSPYFVMELVKGVAITEYCDSHKLNPRQRLELFIPVCQAIQHAHQKGIIHRDIKPSNVLVATYDDRPAAKVIDFGVAKATAAGIVDVSLNTGLNHVVGTPEYMSPEQAGLNSEDIDTRSDVYSLGVLLYELLVGSTPFKKKELEKLAMLEVLRAIREEDPPRPSTKLSTADALPSLSANRSMEPKSLTGLLRLELDWIVMKALEKDRVRRYETANAFAADVMRYLAGEAVQAHPPSRAYRLQKFLRKHRGPVVAAAIIFLSLIGGVVGTTYGLVHANQQRRRAEANQKIAEENYQLARGAVDRYLTQVGSNQLLNEPHMDALRRELLQSAREFYQTFADNRRSDRGSLLDLSAAHSTLGDIAWKMGDHEQAIEEIEASMAVAREAVSDAVSELLIMKAAIQLGSFQMQLGQYDQAKKVLDATLLVTDKGLATDPQNAEIRDLAARILTLRGTVYRRQNQLEAATTDFVQGEKILQSLVDEFPTVHAYARDLSSIYTHRGQMAYQQQQDTESEQWHRKSLALRRSILTLEAKSSEAQFGLASCLSNLGGVLRRLNRLDEGTQLTREAVDVSRKLAEEHPEIAAYQNMLASGLTNLSVLYKVAGKAELANDANQEAISILASIAQQYPSVSRYVLALGVAESNEGNSLLASGQFSDAIVWYDRAAATLKPLRENSDDPQVSQVLRNTHWGRADCFVALNKFSEAVLAFDKTIELAGDAFKPEIRMARALALAQSGDYMSAAAAVASEAAAETADSIVWFDGARVLAASAESAANDTNLAEQSRAELVEDLSAKAVRGLLKAAELDYFKNKRSLDQLESSGFAALQQRADFQQMLSDVSARFESSTQAEPAER